MKKIGKEEWKKYVNIAEVQQFFDMKEDHALNINFCFYFVQPFIFTRIKRIKHGCSSNTTAEK